MTKPADLRTLWPQIRSELSLTMASSHAQPLIQFIDLAVEGRSGQADSARAAALLRVQRKTEGTDRAIGHLSGLGEPMNTRVGIVMGRIKNDIRPDGPRKYGLSTSDLPSAIFIERRILFLDSEMVNRSSTVTFIPTSTTRG